MCKINKRLILDALLYLKENGPLIDGTGICHNLHKIMRKYGVYHSVDDDLIKIFISWEEFSGDKNYPISVSKLVSAAHQYERSKQLWNTKTEYGKARYRLLDFLIDEIKKELKK